MANGAASCIAAFRAAHDLPRPFRARSLRKVCGVQGTQGGAGSAILPWAESFAPLVRQRLSAVL